MKAEGLKKGTGSELLDAHCNQSIFPGAPWVERFGERKRAGTESRGRKLGCTAADFLLRFTK